MDDPRQFPTTVEDWYERTALEQGSFEFGYDPSFRRTHYTWIIIGCVVGSGWAIYSKPDPWLLVSIFVAFVIVVISISEHIFAHLSKRHVEIDYADEVVRIQNFIYPVRFIDIKPKPIVEIPFRKIHTVISKSARGQTSTIVHTTDSRFVINECFQNRFELIKRLQMIAQRGEQPVNKPINEWILKYAVIITIVSTVLFVAYWLGFP